MGRRTNRFRKAIKHIKSTEIDDKLAMLEAAPTNNTMGYMSTGVHGEPKPDTVTNAFPDLPLPDFDQDDPSENGRDTSGLFNPSGVHAEGTKILVQEPPGDTSYVLGPMAAMFYTWSYPWTMIGYIRESDRKMVDLARIDGKLSDWDGVTGFNNAWWGGQLTLEQAVWFRDVKKYNNSGNDPANANYRAFYPGPPSNTPDEHGRYYCVTTGQPKNHDDTVPNPGNTEPTGGGTNPDDVFASLMDKAGKFDWDKFWKLVDAGLLAWDAVSMAGVMFPELGSSILGGMGLGLGRLFRGIARIARGGRAINRARNRGGKNTGGPDVSPNPNGDVPNSTRKGKDFNVDNDTGIVRDDKGNPTFEPTFDSDGNQTGYKPVDPKHIDRGRNSRSSGGDNQYTGHPEYNPGGKYNTRTPVKPKGGGGNTGGGNTGGGGKPPRGGDGNTGGGGADTQYDPNIYTRGRTQRNDPWVDRGSSSDKTSQSIRELVRDNITGVDRQRTSSDPNAGWNPLRGMPGYGTAKGKINPRIRKINQQRKSKGKPELTPDQINPGGYQTGPDEASRRLIKGVGKLGSNVGKSNISKNVTQRQGKKINRRGRTIRESIDYWMWEDAAGAPLPSSSTPPASGTATKTTKISSMNQDQKQEVEDYMVDRIETLIQDPKFVENLDKMVSKMPEGDDEAPHAAGNTSEEEPITGTPQSNPEGYSEWAIQMRGQSAGWLSGYLGAILADEWRSGPETLNTYARNLGINASELRGVLRTNKAYEQRWLNAADRHKNSGYAEHLLQPVLDASKAYTEHMIEILRVVRGGVLSTEPEPEDDVDNYITPSDEAILSSLQLMKQLDKDIEKYSAELKEAHAEMMRIAVEFGINVAMTLFGPALLKWGFKGLGILWKGVRGATAAAKAERTRKSAAKLNKLANELFKSKGKAKQVKIYKAEEVLNGWSSKTAELPRSSAARWMGESHRPVGMVLTESRKSILKNLKKPVVLPKEQKKFKVKPKLRTSNYMGSVPKISKPVETPKEYKKIGGRNLWGQYEHDQNTRQSQERMNQVYELVGDGNMAFDYMLTDSKKLNDEQMEKFWGKNPDFYSYFYGGKKYKLVRKEEMDGDFLVFLIDDHGERSNILQSELNEKLAEEQERKELEEYNKMNPKRKEPISFDKDYMFKKAYQRLKPQVDYKDKPAKKGYPDEPPPEMINGRHPDFGKRPGTSMYNKLDPHSAAAMPQQDDEIIDAKVKDAKENPKRDSAIFRRRLDDKIDKQRKKANPAAAASVEEEKSDWRKELEENWTNVTSSTGVGNRAVTSFQHTSGVKVYSAGLDGIPNPTVEIYGDPVNLPGENEHGLTAPGSMPLGKLVRKSSAPKIKKLNKQLDAAEKSTKKINADEFMKGRVNDFENKVKEVEKYNETVRNKNIAKVDEFLKKVGVTYEELRKGSIKISGGAVGMINDGEKIKVGIFKGTDVTATKEGGVFVPAGGSLEFTCEIGEFNINEGVKPIPNPNQVPVSTNWVSAIIAERGDVVSASNVLSTYENFLSNKGKGLGSSASNPLDITNQLDKNDVESLSNWANSSTMNEKINKYLNAKSKILKDAYASGIQNDLNAYIQATPKLIPVFGGKGGVYPQINLQALDKGKISFNKVYAFRPGGSVEDFEKQPFAWTMEKLGFPADTFGSFDGGVGFNWFKSLIKAVAPAIAARLTLKSDDKFSQEFTQQRVERGETIHDFPLYNAPGMHYQVNVPMNKGTSLDVKSTEAENKVKSLSKSFKKVKKSSKRSGLSLDEPIIRKKKKK